jgi:hypothetical protein
MSQPPRVLSSNSLEVPPDFPSDAYEAVHRGSKPRSNGDAEAVLRTEFGKSWNAVAHRFLAAAHYSDTFKGSAIRNGIGTTPAIQHVEERALFGFFANATSSFDAASYALYVIGTLLTQSSPLHFWLILGKRKRSVKLESTCRAFAGAFPGDPIMSALDAVRTDRALVELKRIRNILTHRALLPRQYRIKIGRGVRRQPTLLLPGIILTEDLLTPYRADLARLLAELLEASAAFTSRHF